MRSSTDPKHKLKTKRMKKYFIVLGIFTFLYLVSFWIFVHAGKIDAGFGFTTFTYTGFDNCYRYKSPRLEKILCATYHPLMWSHRAVGIEIGHMSEPLLGINLPPGCKEEDLYK